MNSKFFILLIPILFLMSSMSLFNLLNNKMILLNISLLNSNSMNIQLNMLIDWMTTSFIATVLIITSFITMYSMSYIPKKEHKRFMLIMMLFVFSMIALIISNNLIMLLIGWDGLGLTSYILVIYYQNATTNASGTITILSNRIGDIMLMMSFATMMTNMTWNISNNAYYTILTLTLMLIAAISKSAQFPFSAWLPAAMAAPTPISALVHSSTLVTAGVYLLIRLSSSFHENTMKMLLFISLFSIIFSSLSAMWEQDMKKIIALSTLSQIALMMFALAINAKTAAFFHMITHALFKSTMFLCAGNMIHTSSYQDMRAMGSMFNKTPLMLSSLGISSMALMSLPFMSSFFSKDAILLFLMKTSLNTLMIMMMITSITMTSIYSLRTILFATIIHNKSKPDTFIDNNKMLSWPPYFMLPASILAGCVLAWYTTSAQTFILPTYMFITLLMMLLFGLIISLSLSFKSYKYLYIGKMAIFMWFMNIMSTTPWMKISHLSTLSLKKDNSWLEQMSAQGSYKLLSSHLTIPILLNKTALFLTVMIFLPMTILTYYL
uniref:NADH-ubiquinone oxidoreductase chain 5 n=1 Tax=Parachtes romandiolae TaxID=1110492 RepID=A0A516IMF6_9ARAC|nr:NADH dehydrogenase subunit 5 [Parachtes romandiolae]QDP17911.1 NADH dehydrogenase subunit 5 [Parachtes romandiolae]